MQEYLKDSKLSLEMKRTVYKWQTHTENFKMNYKNSYDDLNCDICNSHPESQESSFACKGVAKLEVPNVKYSDIFEANIPNNVVRVIQSISESRKVRLTEIRQ